MNSLESRITRSVFRELVSPKVRVWPALINPERVHVVEQVVAAEGDDAESVDGRTCPRRNDGAVREPVLCLGRGRVVVLAVQIAVLRVAAIAEIWNGRVRIEFFLSLEIGEGDLGHRYETS